MLNKKLLITLPISYIGDQLIRTSIKPILAEHIYSGLIIDVVLYSYNLKDQSILILTNKLISYEFEQLQVFLRDSVNSSLISFLEFRGFSKIMQEKYPNLNIHVKEIEKNYKEYLYGNY